MTTDDIEVGLRDALAQKAAEVPAHAADRLKYLNYRPRTMRRSPAVAAGLAAAFLAASGGYLASILPASENTTPVSLAAFRCRSATRPPARRARLFRLVSARHVQHTARRGSPPAPQPTAVASKQPSSPGQSARRAAPRLRRSAAIRHSWRGKPRTRRSPFTSKFPQRRGRRNSLSSPGTCPATRSPTWHGERSEPSRTSQTGPRRRTNRGGDQRILPGDVASDHKLPCQRRGSAALRTNVAVLYPAYPRRSVKSFSCPAASRVQATTAASAEFRRASAALDAHTALGRIHKALKNTEGTPALTIRAPTARGDITARRLGAQPRGGLLDFLEDALEGVHLRLHVVQLGGYLA